MFKVMIRDNIAPLARTILQDTGRIQVEVDNNKENNDPERLAALIGEFDGLAVRSGTKVTRRVIAHAPKLKVIARAGVGVDNIDQAEATAHGVVVMNAPGGNTITTAIHGLGRVDVVGADPDDKRRGVPVSEYGGEAIVQPTQGAGSKWLERGVLPQP